MANQGWIKMYRKSLDSSVWVNPVVWFVWSWCLMKANHQEANFPFNGQDITVMKGSFITGRTIGALECHISEQQWRTAMTYLKSTSRITIKTTNKFSVITICKWKDYQDDNQQTNQPITNQQPTTNQQLTTNNKDKNVNNKNNDKRYHSLQDIDIYAMEEIAYKYKVPTSFVKSKLDDMSNWLTAKGKTYKDYKAALSNWVKTDALKIIQKERQTINKFKVTQV